MTNILVIDDDEIARFGTVHNLRRVGHEPISCATVKEGRQALKLALFDLIVCRPDGGAAVGATAQPVVIESLGRLLEELGSCPIPVLGLTNCGHRPYLDPTVAARIDAWLPTRPTAEDLTAAVARHALGSRSRQPAHSLHGPVDP